MQKQILKKMLIGLLPVLAFIAAEEFFNTQIGLMVGVALGIVQLIYFWILEKKLEKFVLLDTLLIVGMGGISILLHDDIFFKLKPGVVELILVVILGISAFSSKNLILGMQKRYTGDIELGDQQLQSLKMSLRVMFVIFLLHTLLIFYAAFFMSQEAWAFISAGLFYILMGVVFAGQFIYNKWLQKKTEWLPVIDEDGKLLGKATREECKRNPELLHPVVRLHIFNDKGDIFLQKRSLKASIQPGKWDAAMAGHVQFGESIEQAIERELEEELNLKGLKFDLIQKRIFETPKTRALMFIFVSRFSGEIHPDLKETAGGDFFAFSEVKTKLGVENMSPGLLEEWNLLSKVRLELKKRK